MLVSGSGFTCVCCLPNSTWHQVDRFLKDDPGHCHWVFEQNPGKGPVGLASDPFLHAQLKRGSSCNWLEPFWFWALLIWCEILLFINVVVGDFVLKNWFSGFLNRRPTSFWHFLLDNQKSGFQLPHLGRSKWNVHHFLSANSGWQYRDWFWGRVRFPGIGIVGVYLGSCNSFRMTGDVKIHVERGLFGQRPKNVLAKRWYIFTKQLMM